MWQLLRQLRRVRVLTLTGLVHLVAAIWSKGVNPMALLRLAARLHPGCIAVDDGLERLSYEELETQCERLARALRDECGVQMRDKVVIACRNHAAAIKSIFAGARLGANLYLVSPDTPAAIRRRLQQVHQFRLWIQEESPLPAGEDCELSARCLPAYSSTTTSIDTWARQPDRPTCDLPRRRGGEIVVFTGGTSGVPKSARRKASITAYLPPVVALLTQLPISTRQTLLVATPIYHGFGLATLLLGVLLGARMIVRRHFDAAATCELIHQQHVEVVTLVPLMLQRMLQHDPVAMSPLRCIVCGGAPLSSGLVKQCLELLGDVLFNLYGSSEAGLAIMAGPASLARKPESIGRAIRGVEVRITVASSREATPGDVGRLSLRSSWTIQAGEWIDTGDLARRDTDGDIVLCGRADDMIISGGENVYPIELQSVLEQHPAVAAAGVIGIEDADFGQRLKAVIVSRPQVSLTATELRDWLSTRVARHQMPKSIEFREELPTNPLGKLDTRALQVGSQLSGMQKEDDPRLR